MIGRTGILGVFVAALAAAQPESIATTHLPQAVINKPYSFTLAAAPGQTPVWSIAQGSLPAGMTLSSSGVISGVPTVLGANFLLFSANDPVYGIAYQALELDVVLGPANITTGSLPIATQNVAYSTILQGSGGVPPYKWTFATTVTGGMTLDPSSGTLSGTPTNQGATGLPILMTDSIGDQVTRGFTLFVAAPLTVVTASLPNAAAGVAYAQTVQAGGGQAPYTWSAAGLPQGLSINAATGQISGTPAANGTYAVTIGVTDYASRSASQKLVLTVGSGVVVTNSLLAMGTIGVAYSQTLVAAGGQAPYTWAMGAGGSLPPGLSLNAATGVISGTPQFASSLTFSVKATDSLGVAGFGTYTINILAPLRITTTMLPAETPGAKYSEALAAIGGQAPYQWSAANLPQGLSLDAGAGVISGTGPSASSSFSVTVTDSLSHSATAKLAIPAASSSLPAISIGGIPTSPGYLQQPAITVTLASPYTSDLTGTLTLTFTSSEAADGLIQFGTGGNSVTFTIAAGTTSALFSNGKSSVTVLTGTTAGTITLAVASLTANGASVTPSPAPSASFTTSATVPFISSINFEQTSGGVTVTVNGFSSTRDMVNGTFTFTPSTNASFATGTFTISLSAPFTTWYQSSASVAYGTEFTLSVPFSVQGASGDLIAVNVTLTNTKGTSTACAGPTGQTTSCSQ